MSLSNVVAEGGFWKVLIRPLPPWILPLLYAAGIQVLLVLILLILVGRGSL